MKISNVKVYGLKESIKASGYPMMASIPNGYMSSETTEQDLKRVSHLGKAKPGSGHDCFAKGIIVQYDLTCNHVMLPQFMRYHFHDIISSQSKMHRVSKMDIRKCVDSYVDERIIEIVEEEIKEYLLMNEEYVKNGDSGVITQEIISKQYERIMSNLPMGLELTMRITSNYLQLKSIYAQRATHKMSFWHEYCDWILTLPMFKDIMMKG